jgi:hypothetical protein
LKLRSSQGSRLLELVEKYGKGTGLSPVPLFCTKAQA